MEIQVLFFLFVTNIITDDETFCSYQNFETSFERTYELEIKYDHMILSILINQLSKRFILISYISLQFFYIKRKLQL